MKTRSRNYATNPRSPPKRRKRISKKKTKTEPNLDFPLLQDLPPLPPSPLFTPLADLPPLPPSPPYTSDLHPSTPQKRIEDVVLTTTSKPVSHFPDLSTLPPLPNSPISPLSLELNTLYDTNLPELSLTSAHPIEHTSLPIESLSPTSIGTISDLASGFALLNFDSIANDSHVTRTVASYPTPLPETPFYCSNTIFEPDPVRPVKPSDMSTPMTPDQFALDEINQSIKNVGNNINFPHLEKNGSNFVDWKKDTVRAMKAMI
ncbi:uncharacterized protein MELLADRAFT_70322 [Melampsora larici-populina 98AG31]|uniref:Uncharacterized protein n=1 Tax=Melampsora larici-populina (strain 98AG31 / pathotype 3-4-7) TaxID=747676 RepID=F4SEH9_MELLP|nr:uncharacterized protein MELLADRAFT_70322 [Melampsora larici-populina 98AG31]EGF96946.1 hypothetical protein MELLADRAFT_70322 [Melampsora larici-populina 98AG31]